MFWSGIGLTTLLVTIMLTAALWATVLITVRALLPRGRSSRRRGTDLGMRGRRTAGPPSVMLPCSAGVLTEDDGARGRPFGRRHGDGQPHEYTSPVRGHRAAVDDVRGTD